MIKVVNEIPESMKVKQRDMIKADIQEALDKGISLFELDGDCYNYKYLAQYAREVAHGFSAKKVRDIQRKFKKDNFTEDEKTIRGFFVFFKSEWDYDKDWIKITSQKGEKHQRVFCMIGDLNVLEEKVINDCRRELEEARENYVLVNGKWISKKKLASLNGKE